MAKAALEGAIWDLFAKKRGISLAKALGGKIKKINVGVSIGIQSSVDDLLSVIEASHKEGYQRIKIKIKPGWDVEVLKEVRHHFPNIPLMVDANSAYTLNDVDLLKQLDDYQLLMIEQPLAQGDFLGHATLQKQLSTPICLDESIGSLEDARQAIEIGGCKIANIKIGRVGGLTEAKKIHDYCALHDVPVWCGGMLESGIGRAHNIALSTLPQFIFPGDISGSSRYWERDIIEPMVQVHHGVIEVSKKSGMGYEVDKEAMGHFTMENKGIKFY